MKKNVKYLGMAAAALLAVAPVFSTGVVNAADGLVVNAGGGQVATKPVTNNPDGSQQNPFKLDLSRNTISVSTSDAVSNYANSSQLNLKLTTGSVVATSAVTVSDAPTSGNIPTSFEAGKTYYQQATVTVGGLQAGKWYNINGSKVVQASPEGTIANIFVAAPLHAYNSELEGQPYFVDKTITNQADKEVVNLNNGAFAWNPVSFNQGASVASIETAAKNAVQAMVNENGVNKSLVQYETVNDINGQLANQGIAVVNGNLPANATSFYITVSVTNPMNNKTATARVQFNRNISQNVYPAIYQNGTFVKQGSDGNGVDTQTFAQGSDNAKAFAKDPIAYLKLSAQTIKDQNSGHIDIKVLSNAVDPNKSGIYPVTLSATNPNGYTTKVTFNVVITPTGARTATVKYKAGYGVNIWRVLSNTSVAFSGHRIMDGTGVTIYGEKTINGVKYYQINDPKGNEWIQAQYIDGASVETPAKPATKPSTSSKEEAMSGVIVVKYDGRGKVALVDQNGHYGTGNYVSKNAAFKVFAKKTINGKTYYRLGTQSQWIPAQYAQFR